MKKSNKIIAAAATVAVAAMPFGNVFAATAPTWTGGSSATINRQIQNAYGTISNTFTYTISADSGKAIIPTLLQRPLLAMRQSIQ